MHAQLVWARAQLGIVSAPDRRLEPEWKRVRRSERDRRRGAYGLRGTRVRRAGCERCRTARLTALASPHRRRGFERTVVPRTRTTGVRHHGLHRAAVQEGAAGLAHA